MELNGLHNSLRPALAVSIDHARHVERAAAKMPPVRRGHETAAALQQLTRLGLLLQNEPPIFTLAVRLCLRPSRFAVDLQRVGEEGAGYSSTFGNDGVVQLSETSLAVLCPDDQEKSSVPC